MNLVRLRVQNFRPFHGSQEVRFASDPERNVTVITGNNGTGKSSLFYALNWVLYGAEGLPPGIVNQEAAMSGASAVALVELEFLHEGRRYLARRTQVAQSGQEREQSFTLEELGARGDTTDLRNPEGRINAILPRDARPYFFFDGERIRELTQAGHEDLVKQAASRVLKVYIVERLVQHLSECGREFLKALKDTQLNQEEQQLLQRIEALEDSIQRSEEDLLTAKKNSSLKEIQHHSVRQKLERLADVRDLQAEEDRCRRRIEQLTTERGQVVEALRTAIGQSGSVLTREAVRTAMRTVDEKRTKGEVPSGIRQTLIEDLLHAGTCICGRHLDEASRTALSARAQAAVPDRVAELVAQAAGNLRALDVRRSQVLRSLTDGVHRLAAIREELLDAQRELDAVERRRAGRQYAEDVGKLEDTRRILFNELVDARAEIKQRDREIADARAERDLAEAKLKSIQARSAKAAQAKARYELAATAAQAATDVLQSYSADMRAKIQTATNEMFLKFMWKKEEFESVKVTDDYRLEVMNRRDQDALVGLSEGERQMLSLAFLAGMTGVTGEDAPLVIDTPFARLAEMPINSIVKELPQITNQLVLLVTDREETSSAALLKPRVGRRYALRFDDMTGRSAVEELN